MASFRSMLLVLVASALMVEVTAMRIKKIAAKRKIAAQRNNASWPWWGNDEPERPEELEPCFDERCFSYSLEELKMYAAASGLTYGQVGKECTDTCSRMIGGGELHAQADILALGDSEASLSGKMLEQLCKGKRLNNLAISGSTALQWSQKEASGLCGQSQMGACSAEQAFSSMYGSGYTHVWLSLGGNDFLESMCTMGEEELTQKIYDAVKSVRDAAGPDVTIVMFGYPMPTAQVQQSYCPTLEPTQRLMMLEQKNACAMDGNCRFVETALVAGGAPSYDEFSPGDRHADAIHLNTKGYCTMFTMKDVQDAFGCELAEQSEYSC